MTTYEPGTVAVATVRGVPNVRVFRHEGGWWSTAVVVRDLVTHSSSDSVTDVRPLVVLDPEDRTTARRFAENAADGDAAKWRVDDWQNFLRSLAKPPKPPEPTGLGAVVEDAEGRAFVRWHSGDAKGMVAPWRLAHEGTPDHRAYADIPAVRVLSEGVPS